MAPTLSFDSGLLVLKEFNEHYLDSLSGTIYDNRCQHWVAPGYLYRDIVFDLFQRQENFIDHVREYEKVDLHLKTQIIPREHQRIALKSWKDKGARGVVSLPTGAGKTILAVMAIAEIKRPTLIVVPTIDLLHQWQKTLESFLGIDVGILGGGQRSFKEVTVSTYDSASILFEKIAPMFGFIVFDECHHLPSPQYQQIAQASIAPFRLGLSATVERPDGKEEIIYKLLGPLVYRGTIESMVSDVLSPYDVVSLEISLTEEELIEYKKHRKIYVDFLRRSGVNFSSPDGWQEFIKKSTRMPGGREAMTSYRLQKQLSQASQGKINELWNIVQHHSGERIIIFTNDNALAYEIGEQYFLPVLTHQTRPKERKKMLSEFRRGTLDILVTSKVLNEGVDVPEASVGIVVSGSGAVREHVQRLGRILRHKKGKRAILYELISSGTGEKYVNKRRRMHDAYQKSP